MSDVSATTPEALAGHFVALFAAGDIETLTTLYEPDAVFVPAPGQRAVGHAEIAAALGALRGAGVRIALEHRALHVAGDIGVLSNTATVTGATPDGTPIVAPTVEVVRRQPDGNWRYVVDDPSFLA